MFNTLIQVTLAFIFRHCSARFIFNFILMHENQTRIRSSALYNDSEQDKAFQHPTNCVDIGRKAKKHSIYKTSVPESQFPEHHGILKKLRLAPLISKTITSTQKCLKKLSTNFLRSFQSVKIPRVI